ncbi:hypothetical protein AA16373_1270 [Komagataeibacter swingsii DSM 16373]|nr:hypothetical protein AA16373_1270 [Komagataeibacter swingsii DSM 16373]
MVACKDILCRLREAVYQPDNTARGTQRLRQKDWQDRIEHLRRNIGKQACDGQKDNVP